MNNNDILLLAVLVLGVYLISKGLSGNSGVSIVNEGGASNQAEYL
jgi:hypothetical protein